MKSTTLRWDRTRGWLATPSSVSHGADLVLYFAASDVLADPVCAPLRDLRSAFPSAACVGCSSAGEIRDSSVEDDGLSALVIGFENGSSVSVVSAIQSSGTESAETGRKLGRELPQAGLRHVLVLSDGLCVNGSLLTEGLRAVLPAGVTVSGGLAGDGARFARTFVGVGDSVDSGRVAVIGLYGDHLSVKFGSAGGWQAFGPTRLITESSGNVLHTLDGQPALALYKRYLGDLASGLPATGLLFPLQLLGSKEAADGVVRTILAVDEEKQSLTFAGDMPQGQYVRLMKAGCDALVDGADSAAAQAGQIGTPPPGAAAVLVSCVGRKLVMKQRVEEEVEAVLQRLGGQVRAAGFYSYGEICPSGFAHSCDFHNQTMTLCVIAER
ncbi:FIST signal transduction protein [Nibricoccus sp. IMCC34717]|uniref:FIST signal transduction protein n=1 Tax=Nibricoccus sp. IMCC34717 TaxID=3034021 RepID=UPI00384A55D7